MNQQPRKRGSSLETVRMESIKGEIRLPYLSPVTKALTMAWAACHLRLSPSSDFISFLSPALFTCSSLVVSLHIKYDTLSHEDISGLETPPPDICMFHCLSSPPPCPKVTLCWALHPPYLSSSSLYQILLSDIVCTLLIDYVRLFIFIWLVHCCIPAAGTE